MMLVFFDGSLKAEHIDYKLEFKSLPKNYCRRCDEATSEEDDPVKCPRCNYDYMFSRNASYKYVVIVPMHDLPSGTVVQMIEHDSGVLGAIGMGVSSRKVIISVGDTPAGKAILGRKVES